MDTFNDFINSDDMNIIRNKYENLENLINKKELEIIFEGIEKTDFTMYGENRWRDLDKIIKNIIEKKNRNNNYNLKELKLVNLIELYIPINIYYYNFD